MSKVRVVGTLEIPCRDDKVVSIHGATSGTAAGTCVVDVRDAHLDDIVSAVDGFLTAYRNVQLVCTAAQFEPLMARVQMLYVVRSGSN